MIKTPMCSWDRHKSFKLATIPEVFVIPDFQRVLTEAHKSGIADAILNNNFYDNSIQVGKLPNGKYEVYNGQHRLAALYHVSQEFGLVEYEIILQIFDKEYGRKIFYRLNLGKQVTLQNLTKTFDDGNNVFFNHLRDVCSHKQTKKTTTFSNLLSALRFAKTGSPRALPKQNIEHFMAGITKSDKTFCVRFMKAMGIAAPYVPQSEAYRAPIFRGTFRAGYENDWNEETLKKVIREVQGDQCMKDIIGLGGAIVVTGYAYQYITSTLCPRIHVAAEQIEAPEYTTRGGRIVG